MTWIVYVLKSEKISRFYRGMTQDINRRLKGHNLGVVKSTKAFIPWALVYSEECANIKEARKEKFLKSGDGRRYIKSLL